MLKLFGINNGNIKNNTIFAQQYLLLGKPTQEVVDSQSSIQSEEQTPKVTVAADDTQNVEDDDTRDQIEEINNEAPSIDDGYIDFEEFDMLAKTSDISDDYINDIVNNDGNATAETFGVTRVSNINDYLNTFSHTEKPIIAKMLKNGEIKYMCR